MKQTYQAILEYKDDDDSVYSRIVMKPYKRESAMWDKVFCIKRTITADDMRVVVKVSSDDGLELEYNHIGDQAILCKCHEFGSVDRCYNR